MGSTVLFLVCFSMLGSASTSKIVRLSPQAAVKRALEHNLSLQIARLAPELSDAPRRAARAAFDPVVFGEVGTGGDLEASETRDENQTGTKSVSPALDVTASVGIRKTFMTGTSLEVRFSGDLNRRWENGAPATNGVTGAAAVTVRQPLLRGAGTKINRAAIQTARLERQKATAMLHRKAEQVAEKTLDAYWALYAAQANLRVQKVGLAQARKTLAETEALIAAGKVAAAEKVAAAYGVQVQRRAVRAAQKEVGNSHDELARILGWLSAVSGKNVDLVLDAAPLNQAVQADVAELTAVALKRRGDHVALQRSLQVRRLASEVSSHLLLPKLDLTASVGVARLDRKLAITAETMESHTGSTQLAWSVGLMLEIPLGNRAAKAQQDTAALAVRRAQLSIVQSAQQITAEIKTAWRSVESSWDALKLTRAAAELAELKFENERDRFRAGKSTAQMLTLVQSDMLKERLALQDALAKFNRALVALRAASGTLIVELEQRA